MRGLYLAIFCIAFFGCDSSELVEVEQNDFGLYVEIWDEGLEGFVYVSLNNGEYQKYFVREVDRLVLQYDGDLRAIDVFCSLGLEILHSICNSYFVEINM